MVEDEIDTSEFLPPGVPVVNQFRLNKPDIVISHRCGVCAGSGTIDDKRCKSCHGDGRTIGRWRGADMDPLSDVRYAQARVRNILGYLHHKGHIDDQQAHDGRTYEIWFEIFKATSSMQKKPLYGDLRGELANEGLSEYGFVLLIQGLHKHYHDLIQQMIYHHQTEHNIWLAARRIEAYKTALNRLGVQILEIREKLKQIAERNEATKATEPA